LGDAFEVGDNVSELCFAFSELEVGTHSAAVFGAFAEDRISARYLKDVGRFKTGGPTNFFPFIVKDFHDPANTWGRADLFGEFIMTHNPKKLTENQWRMLKVAGGMVRVPDLITHDPPKSDFEYYEIKPASPDGRAAGLAKCAILDAIFAYYKLPYVKGSTWNVSGRELLMSGPVWGTNVELYLHYFQSGPGLVFYEVCAKGNFEEILEKVGTVVFVAGLIALLMMSPGILAAPAAA
jgi:hypothetical protein